MLHEVSETTALALQLLESPQDASVRLRLYSDVLAYPSRSPAFQAARADLRSSPAVQQIAADQREDGGWGRFHSAKSTARRAIPTTEFAVRRAFALGLSPRSPMLSRAADYTEALLAGAIPFPDPPEKNDRWRAGCRLFVTSSLSLIRPRSTALRATSRTWASILEAAFHEGRYDPKAEASAHRRLTGATVQGTYLELNNRYAVELLAADANHLPMAQCRGYMEWLATSRTGIGYLGVPLVRPETLRTPSEFDRWLVSWELLSRFPGWQECATSAMDWLWSYRMRDGLWDFGPRPGLSEALPLSSDWRTSHKRQADWSSGCCLSLLDMGCATQPIRGCPVSCLSERRPWRLESHHTDRRTKYVIDSRLGSRSGRSLSASRTAPHSPTWLQAAGQSQAFDPTERTLP